MKHKKRQALTLVEMMLVMVLIALVGGALAFNLRGALDKGKAFKTKETKKKIEAILSIAAVDENPSDVINDWEQRVATSPLIKVKLKQNKEIQDGWGNPFTLNYDDSSDQFIITSPKINADGEIIP